MIFSSVERSPGEGASFPEALRAERGSLDEERACCEAGRVGWPVLRVVRRSEEPELVRDERDAFATVSVFIQNEIRKFFDLNKLFNQMIKFWEKKILQK